MPDTAPVPPLPADTLLHLLLALAVLLALARALGALAERVGLPAIVGELLTGVLLGPSLLGWLAPGVAGWLLPPEPGQMHLLDGIGQIGLLLLVALTGTHLDLRSVRRQGRTAVTVSLGGLLVPLASGIAIGFALAGALAADGPTATAVFPLFLGVAMCVTAIPVIAKTLTDMGLLHRNIGQLTLAAGMVDDAVGWLLLSVVSAAATTGVATGQIAVSVAVMLGFVLLAAVIGRPVVRRLMERTTRSASPGPTVAAAVVVVLAGAATTHALHMEAIFGAFVAGILLATAGPAVQERLAPLRTVTLSVLAPVFLATAGLRMDLTALARPDVLLAALAVLGVAIAGKFVGAYAGARLSGLSTWEGLALGAGMNARGVVEVIIALTGLRLGVLDTAGYTVIVLVAVVTSLMAPPLLRFAMSRVAQDEEERLRAIDHATWAGQVPGTAGGAPR
jgi:Kef-type K+ transport system membrane component KefB